MNDEEKRREELVNELVEIRQRMAELNKSAIKNKLAEEELIKSEERYRSLVELSPDMIGLHSRGKYVYINPAGVKLLGASGPDDLIGKSIFKIIHPDSIEIARERIKQLEQEKTVPLVEERFIQMDGTIVDVEVAAAPIFFQGEPMVQVIARDISERKRMEEALRRSEEAAQRLAQENAIIAEIGRIISSTLDIEEVYGHFAEAVRKLISFDRIAINIINPQDRTFIIPYAAGLEATGRKKGDVIPLAGTAAEEVMRTRSNLLLGKLEESVSRFPGLLPLLEAGFHSMMLVPLISRDRVIGILNLQLGKPPLYTEQDLKLAEHVGTQITGAIANVQLYNDRKRAEEISKKSEEEAKRLSQENAVMAEIGRIIGSTLRIEEVYDRFAEEVRKLIPLDRICISVLKPETAMMENAYVSGTEVTDRKAGNSYPLAGSIGEEIIRTRKSLLVQTEDPDEVRGYSSYLLTTFQAGLRSMLSVPLISQDQVIGILHIRSLRTNAYAGKEVKLAEEVGNQIAGAIASASLYGELKEAKDTLQKREKEFRELYDHAPLGYHEYNSEGKITRVNKTDLEMLGYTAEEMIGQPMWKFNFEEEFAKEQILEKLGGRLPPARNLVRTYRRKDGSILPVLIEDRLLKDERGEIIGIRCTIQDITERRRAEEAQRKSEEEAKYLARENAVMAEIGRIVTSTLDLETVYERFAGEVRKILSFDRISINVIDYETQTFSIPYIFGTEVRDRLKGEVVPLKGTVVAELMRSRRTLLASVDNQKDLIRQLPGVLPLYKAGFQSMIWTPLISKDRVIGLLAMQSTRPEAYTDKDTKLAERVANQIAGAIASALLFRERERAEEALQKKEEEAQQLARQNAILAEIGRIISSTMNIKEVFELLAGEAKKLIPFDRMVIGSVNQENNTITQQYVEGISAPGRNRDDSFPLEGSFAKAVIEAREGLILGMEDEKAVLSKYPLLFPEIQAGLKSALGVPLIWRDQVIGTAHFRSRKRKAYSAQDLRVAQNIANQIAGAIRSAQLFSEQERAEKEKASLQQQLHQSQKMEAIGKLAGGIAHDFNNLLTIISTNAQLALTELKSWDPLKGKLESIHKAGERAANLIGQLLAFSRRQVVDMKVIDLNSLLQELGKMLVRVIGEDVSLSTILAKDLGRVKADPGQIEQVILNLVVNARDAMPSGGKLAIETANVGLDREYTHTHLAVKPGQYVMLSVSDTGVGMSPEVRERVFEPFFTTKEKGTGLGLSTVYGVVKQSGGYIWAYSEPGRGSTFKIYLPRVDEPLGEEIRKKVVNGGLPGGKETILVAEDEEEVRKLAVDILRKQGYRILEAPHGGDAFLICEQGKEPVDLLLTDVVMPGLNGPELARRLQYFYPEMKVLFMSGYTDNTIFQQGVLDHGMFFLQKPFSVEGLVGKVREVLDR